MDGKKQFWKGLATGAVLMLVVMGAVFLGRGLLERAQEEKRQEEQELDLTNRETRQKLEEIQQMIELYYLEDIDPELVENYLYKGVLAGLGDIYSVYYTEDEYQSMLDSTNGSYCGIGVEISQSRSTGIATISRVFEGSPAMEAGLLPGDVLYKVDDREVTGEDLTKVVTWIKGEEGTKVVLQVVREDEPDYLEFEVERRTIEIQTISSEMLENQVGYIAISSFDDVTLEQFLQAMDDLEAQGMEALVVDLRNNGGGLVSTVCGILDRLLPEGILVYTEDKYGNRVEETSDAEHYFDKPMAVLINENSASASEIFAGAIKDYEAGTLVGTTTFGKGIVQRLITLSDGTALKLTVSKYYTPAGNNIHEIGIEPDVEVELEKSLRNDAVIPKEKDNQLQKALETLGRKPGTES